MVVINHCDPVQLNAYSTVPLSLNVSATVQQDFALGSCARFGNPIVTISIQNRPDFYGASHYTMREKLDTEGFLDQFLIIDNRTAQSHAIWYVETTEASNEYTAQAIEDQNPPVTHEGEDFTLWQARIATQDMPVQWACFDVVVRELIDDIEPYTHPYDPHNPQQEPFTLGIDWSRKEDAAGFWGDAYIEAEFEEIEWSTDIHFRRLIAPTPPVVVRLTKNAAREAGLLRAWRPAEQIPRPGDTVSTSAPYDWDSPRWSQNGMNVLKRSLETMSRLSLPTASVAAGTCRSRRLLGLGFNRFRTLAGGVNGLLLAHKGNVSQTLPESA